MISLDSPSTIYPNLFSHFQSGYPTRCWIWASPFFSSTCATNGRSTRTSCGSGCSYIWAPKSCWPHIRSTIRQLALDLRLKWLVRVYAAACMSQDWQHPDVDFHQLRPVLCGEQSDKVWMNSGEGKLFDFTYCFFKKSAYNLSENISGCTEIWVSLSWMKLCLLARTGI